MSEQRVVQIAISAAAVAAIGAHMIWPALKIDAVTLALLITAAIPWTLALFAEIELPGGWKFRAAALRKSEERAERAGLLSEPAEPAPPDHEYSFQVVADEDPNLALAGLRIEIERALNRLAKSAGLASERGGKSSVGRSLRLLSDEGVLTQEQRAVLADMIGLLNGAVHGTKVDQRTAQWALDVGPRLLATLKKRLAD